MYHEAYFTGVASKCFVYICILEAAGLFQKVKAALRPVFLALLLVWPQTPSLLHAPSHPGERGGCLPLEEAPQEAQLVFWQCCVGYKHKCITKRGRIL